MSVLKLCDYQNLILNRNQNWVKIFFIASHYLCSNQYFTEKIICVQSIVFLPWCDFSDAYLVLFDLIHWIEKYGFLLWLHQKNFTTFFLLCLHTKSNFKITPVHCYDSTLSLSTVFAMFFKIKFQN